jgi:exopolyphosphatase/guanosine-5'-triphosphate,3'-diphosphate pyrophosphatase
LKTLAAIDVGSNSVLLLIAKTGPRGSIVALHQDRETPRLSAGLAKTGRISALSQASLIRAIRKFVKTCGLFNADPVLCCGTSALREASNAKDVIESVERVTGIRIRVISGKREAALTYLAAVTGMPRLKSNRVMIDAGGSSTEIVIAKKNRIISAGSFRIGAVQLTEMYRTNRKQRLAKLESILDSISSELRLLKLPHGLIAPSMILSGGTPTTIQAYRLGLREYDHSRVHGASVRSGEYKKLVFELGMMPIHDRMRAISFDPKRADVIVAGGFLTVAMMEHYGAGTVRISDRSLRYGMLLEQFGRVIEFA